MDEHCQRSYCCVHQHHNKIEHLHKTESFVVGKRQLWLTRQCKNAVCVYVLSVRCSPHARILADY